jgi:uncharacterized protein YkwD
MLWRYCGKLNITKSDASKLPDYGNVSDYALSAINWAYGYGIMTGSEVSKGVFYLLPQGNATRAQMAKMLYMMIGPGDDMPSISVWPDVWDAADFPGDQSSEYVQLGIPGTYYAIDEAKAKALVDEINNIRAEAHKKGVTIDGTVVSGSELQWSQALECVAQVRSVEANVFFSHQCPANGKYVFERSSFLEVGGENLGLTSDSSDPAVLIDAIVNAFISEKGDKTEFTSKDKESETIGHYVNIICDDYSTIGIGCFSSGGYFALAMEFGESQAASSSLEVRDGFGVQMIGIAGGVDTGLYTCRSGKVDGGGTISLNVGQVDSAIILTEPAVNGGDENIINRAMYQLVSSDPSVVRVGASYRLTGVSPGTAEISLYSGTTKLNSFYVNVVG